MENYIMILWNNITNKEIRWYFDAYPDEVLIAANDELELAMITNHTRSIEILLIKQIDYKGE